MAIDPQDPLHALSEQASRAGHRYLQSYVRPGCDVLEFAPSGPPNCSAEQSVNTIKSIAIAAGRLYVTPEDVQAAINAHPDDIHRVVIEACGLPLQPWQRKFLADLEAQRVADRIRLMYGDPDAPKPTGIMYADAVVLDKAHEHTPALPPKWAPGEPWRRQGKRRGRMS